MTRAFAALVLALTPVGGRAADPPKPPAALQGEWLFDALRGQRLGPVWESVVTVKGDTFTLTKFMGAKDDLKGTLRFDPNDPTAVDLILRELDLSHVSKRLPDYKLSAGTLACRFKLDGDRLLLCLPHDYKVKRPTAVASGTDYSLATLVRPPKGFVGFPKELKVSVVGPDGKPAAGALVCQQIVWRDGNDRKEPPRWEYVEEVACRDDGTVTLARDKVVFGVLIARGAAKDTMGVAVVSPARWATGAARIELRPQVRVTGTLTCDELTKAGHPLGWAGAALSIDGASLGSYSTPEGKFEFFAPPGKYTLGGRGAETAARSVEITVPDDRTEFAVPPLDLPALEYALLKGKPAPEFVEVLGWKGDAVKLADMKGQYVLLEFWGYWCGPCLARMPTLIELHERFAGKGLAVVGVHLDLDGDVDTAAKLDAKLKAARKEFWKDKDLPFPNVLVSGVRVGEGDDKRFTGTAARYDVRSFPTTLLIDRDGKVVGRFDPHDTKDAVARIEKLLAAKK